MLYAPGWVALGVTPQGSRRSVLAQLTHTARPVADSRALCYPWSFRGQLVEVLGPRAVARPRFRDEAPPSLHRVLWHEFPGLTGTMGRSDSRPFFPSHFVSFARRLLPRAPVFVTPAKPDAGLGPGVFGSGHPSAACRYRGGNGRASQVPGEPPFPFAMFSRRRQDC
jgi:hypothetical protein